MTLLEIHKPTSQNEADEAKAQYQRDVAIDIWNAAGDQWLTRYSFQRAFEKKTGVWLKDNVASRIISNLECNNGFLEKSDAAIFKGETHVKVYAWRKRANPGQKSLFCTDPTLFHGGMR